MLVEGMRGIGVADGDDVDDDAARQGHEREDGQECRRMQREVEALEALVDRYQEELEHSRSTMRDPLVDGDTCAHASLIGVTEEVYEHQRLYPSGWLSDLHTSDPPATASASGDPKSFDSVRLPSTEWEWTGEWRIDVTSSTDNNGWCYAGSWDELTDLRGPLVRRVRSLRDFVRRRRWIRDRVYMGSRALPSRIRTTLETAKHKAALELENDRLRAQLMRAQGRIAELEEQTARYEVHITDLQQAMHQLSRARRSQSTGQRPELDRPDSTRSLSAYSIGKSADVLHQTEQLLDQILGGHGLSAIEVEETLEAQRRRSQMVEECQNELEGAVAEFQHMLVSADERKEPSALPGRPPRI